jgi:hypothetical protein
MNKMDGWIYFSYDADSAGRRVGKAILSDDPTALKEVSGKIKLGNDLIHRWAYERGGIQYSSGGDQGVYAIPHQYEKSLEALRQDYKYATGLTISVGLGHHLSESGQALLMAKLKGKDRIVKYDKNIRKEIKDIRKRAKKGKFKSMEEYKIAEAYLDKSEQLAKADGNGIQKELAETVEKPDTEQTEEVCQYCDQTDGVDPDHCQYCHNEAPGEGEADCQYCQEQELNPIEGKPDPATDGGCQYCQQTTAETGEDTCKYCGYDRPGSDNLDFPEVADQDDQFGKEKEQQDNRPHAPVHGLVSPDSNNDQSIPGSKNEKELYNKMGMNPPEIGKPAPPDKRPPIGQGPVAEVQLVQEDRSPANQDPNQRLDDQRDVPKEPQRDPEDNHSKEAMMNIARQIEEQATPNATNRDEVGVENLPSGTNMEGNISRPDGFEQQTPGDMGEPGANQTVPEDDEPDMMNIFSQGLDNHSESINKEKAIQSISQALMRFKAAKQSLEMSRDQMPQLYQASLGILKAMIDMAGMLGLGQATPELGQATPELGQATPELGQVQAELMPEQPEAALQDGNEWHDPFPKHPDQGGSEQKPGHAPPSKSSAPALGGGKDGGIGQSIKQLPTKATSGHVARTPLPVGGVNALGQQKVMDNQGNIRFISRKQGMVQGPSGVPVKPPKG